MKTIYITTPAPQIETAVPSVLRVLRRITRVACNGQEAVMIVTEEELSEVIYIVEMSDEELAIFEGKPELNCSNQIF